MGHDVKLWPIPGFSVSASATSALHVTPKDLAAAALSPSHDRLRAGLLRQGKITLSVALKYNGTGRLKLDPPQFKHGNK